MVFVLLFHIHFNYVSYKADTENAKEEIIPKPESQGFKTINKCLQKLINNELI